MVRNEGTVDRVVRAVVGVVLLAAWVFGWLSGATAVVLGIVGAILVVTAAIGFCPLYALLGIRTSPAPTKR